MTFRPRAAAARPAPGGQLELVLVKDGEVLIEIVPTLHEARRKVAGAILADGTGTLLGLGESASASVFASRYGIAAADLWQLVPGGPPAMAVLAGLGLAVDHPAMLASLRLQAKAIDVAVGASRKVSGVPRAEFGSGARRSPPPPYPRMVVTVTRVTLWSARQLAPVDRLMADAGAMLLVDLLDQLPDPSSWTVPDVLDALGSRLAAAVDDPLPRLEQVADFGAFAAIARDLCTNDDVLAVEISDDCADYVSIVDSAWIGAEDGTLLDAAEAPGEMALEAARSAPGICPRFETWVWADQWEAALPSVERAARAALGARHQCQGRECMCGLLGNEYPAVAAYRRGFTMGLADPERWNTAMDEALPQDDAPPSAPPDSKLDVSMYTSIPRWSF